MGLFEVPSEKVCPKNLNDLLRVLKYGKDPVAQKATVEAIAEAKNDDAARTFIKALKYFDERVECGKETKRNQAYIIKEIIESLVRIGQPSVEPLVRILTARTNDLRLYAQRALVRIGEPSVQPLIQAARRADAKGEFYFEPDDSDERIVGGGAWVCSPMSIAETLVKIRRPSIRGLSKTLERTNSSRLRDWARSVLKIIGDKSVVPYVFEIVKDGKRGGQREVECLLNNMEEPEMAIEGLIRALRDRNAIVRSKAAEILGQMGARRAVNPLIHCLGDKSPDVRKSAARALGAIRDKRAIEFLTQTYKEDYDRSVQKEAKRALREIERKKKTSCL